jgi:SAM-dependent methyltransferase
VVFGEDAASYERARPPYPREAVEHVLGLVDARSAVEVGAGTGKATEAFARHGLEITCLEPSSEMAALLDAKALPGVTVVVATFEEWEDPSPHSYDLAYAAQAWHWVDRAVAYDKARSVLRPGGVLTLMWNIPADRYSMFEEVYSAHAPHLLAESDDRIKRRDGHDWLEDMAAAGLTGLERFTRHWSAELTARAYRDLYSTYSDHMMLPEPARTALLDGLESTVGERGGRAIVEYRTEVFSGRV